MIVARTDDIAACHRLRHAVFVDEQGITPEDEFDGRDGEAIHLLAMLGGVPVGTARLFVTGDIGKIGRVCVLSAHRGTGIGAALIRAALTELRVLPGVRLARLGAQTHAIAFYEALGFTAHGPLYDDAGIAHRDMDLTL
jgi:ElaA protein